MQLKPKSETKDGQTPRVVNKKRLRHVFKNPAHVWANPLQKDGSGFEQTNGRVAHGNWYFKTSSDGTRVIYSYGDTYVIGSRFELGCNVIFLLRSGKPYSPTTSKHMCATRAAVPKDNKNVVVFAVPAMVCDYNHTQPGRQEHAYNLQAYVAEIADAIERHLKARSSYNVEGRLQEATNLTAEIKQYAKVFKLKLPVLPKLPKLDAAKIALIAERERIRDEKAAIKRAASEAAWEARRKAEADAWKNGPGACKHLDSAGEPMHSFLYRYRCEEQREREDWEVNKAQLIERWRAGENVTLRFAYSEPAILRVKDGNVETSQHASVPISGQAGAARLFRFLVALKETGRTYQRNGHSQHIGNFVVESFDGETLRIGCHQIAWGECAQIAAYLNTPLEMRDE